jgi:hypothetical protein
MPSDASGKGLRGGGIDHLQDVIGSMAVTTMRSGHTVLEPKYEDNRYVHIRRLTQTETHTHTRMHTHTYKHAHVHFNRSQPLSLNHLTYIGPIFIKTRM